jgi:hypothetical protein
VKKSLLNGLLGGWDDNLSTIRRDNATRDGMFCVRVRVFQCSLEGV